MAIEIEKKYLGADFGQLPGKLRELRAKSFGAHFETNIMFDFPGNSLFAQKKLVRLRKNEWPDRAECILTCKGPARIELEGMKSREEIECGLQDATRMREILLAIGLVEVARYEKIRQSFELWGAKIELDTVPFGKVVEIEAGPEAFGALEKALGRDKCETSSKSYHELHQQWRVQNRLEPDASFVFPEKIRQKERQGIGLS